MVYNKFRQGFLKNILAYIVMIITFVITVLLIIFAKNLTGILVTLICFGILMIGFVYDLFLSDVFIFKDDSFSTNKYPFNSPKYAPKLFRKISVQFNEIVKIEKRLWNARRYVLVINFKDEEPLQYVFTNKDTRDFIYNKFSELIK